jgi:hypothetical protein
MGCVRDRYLGSMLARHPWHAPLSLEEETREIMRKRPESDPWPVRMPEITAGLPGSLGGRPAIYEPGGPCCGHSHVGYSFDYTT